MTTFDVEGMGKITVRTGKLVEMDGGFRRYHTVQFRYSNGGMESYSVGSAVFRFGSEHRFSLYDTVYAALSFLEDDKSPDADDWTCRAAIPFGTAHVYRRRYHVIDDGHGGSDATDGETEREAVTLTRFYGESAGEAVWRCLSESDLWTDAGTFDSLCPPFTEWDTWTTVPVEDDADDIGVPCVEHGVRFTGDVTQYLTEVAAEWTENGRAWR